MRLPPILIVIVLLCQCTQKKDGKVAIVNHTRPGFIEKPHSTNQDTLTIKIPGAVFFGPDSLQLKMVKDLLDTSAFNAMMHDYFYESRFARKEIGQSWPELVLANANNYRYLLFIKRDETRKCIDLDKKNDLYGVILFDGKKDPVLADMPNIKTVAGFYFNRR